MFCGNCGTQLPENAKFCGNCGTKTGEVSVYELSSPPVNNQTVNEPSASASDEDDGRSLVDKAIDKAEKKHPFIFWIIGSAVIILFIYIVVTGIMEAGKNISSVAANNSQQNQGSTTTQKPQSNSSNSQQTTPSNTETLTYYINGNAKTANVVFMGYQEKRFFLDAGGNVVLYGRLQRPGENWTDWESEGIVQRQDGSFDDVGDIAFWLNEISFSNAVEETKEGRRFIFIWQKIDDLLFGTTKNFLAVDFDNDCVYTMQKVYERK
jgi:hypothetical protein